MANLKAENSELAGALARELKDLKSDLEVDVQEFRETEEAYQGNLKSIKLVQHDFAAKVERLERQLDRAAVKEAQAEAVSGLSGVSFSIADLGDTLKGVEDLLEKKMETSSGKLRLVRDLAAGDGLRGSGERTPRHRTTGSGRLHGPSGVAIGGGSQAHRIAGTACVPTRV